MTVRSAAVDPSVRDAVPVRAAKTSKAFASIYSGFEEHKQSHAAEPVKSAKRAGDGDDAKDAIVAPPAPLVATPAKLIRAFHLPVTVDSEDVEGSENTAAEDHSTEQVSSSPGISVQRDGQRKANPAGLIAARLTAEALPSGNIVAEDATPNVVPEHVDDKSARRGGPDESIPTGTIQAASSATDLLVKVAAADASLLTKPVGVAEGSTPPQSTSKVEPLRGARKAGPVSSVPIDRSTPAAPTRSSSSSSKKSVPESTEAPPVGSARMIDSLIVQDTTTNQPKPETTSKSTQANPRGAEPSRHEDTRSAAATNPAPPPALPETSFAVRLTDPVPTGATLISNPSSADIAKPSETAPLAPAAPIEEPPAPKTHAVSQVSFRIQGANDTNAVIRVVERAGEIKVSVHAAEPELSSVLRANVSDLKTSLETAGWKTEVWKPQATEQDAQSPASHAGKQNEEPPQQQQRQRPQQPDWFDALEKNA